MFIEALILTVSIFVGVLAAMLVGLATIMYFMATNAYKEKMKKITMNAIDTQNDLYKELIK